MNLWFRLIAYLLTMRWRPRLALPGDVSRLDFRVWPHDLDPSLHMNNARYLAMMDLGRLDVMVGGGLWRAVLRHRWTPIASKVAIRFRRELPPFQRFRLETRLVTWDETAVVMEQVFVMAGGRRDGRVAAHALFKGGLYDRTARAFVPIARLLAEAGVAGIDPPPATPEVAAFLAADTAMRETLARGSDVD
jgi:acyl-CoA thioesterase FadM